MNLRQAIKSRRSIRQYLDRAVSKRDIKQIIESGMEAPSAGNLQSRFFYVITEQATRGSLAAAAWKQDFIAEAPVAIVVCADLRIRKEYGARGANLLAVMDCAASMQNMLLTAHSLGLGACWVSGFEEKKVAKLLKTPAHHRPVAILSLGYAAEKPSHPPRARFEAACKIR